MKNRTLLILEIIWIVVGIWCLAAAVRFIINSDNQKTVVFVLMSLVSFAFAWIRHRHRKKG